MRSVALILGALLLLPTAVGQTAFEEHQKAIRAIRCDCGCHPQTVEACECGRAAQMREELAQLVDEGMTGEQIIEKFVEEKGEQSLIAPRQAGFNLLAWIGPLVALVLVIVSGVVLIRRWSQRPALVPATADGAPAPSDVSDQELEELRRQRAEWER